MAPFVFTFFKFKNKKGLQIEKDSAGSVVSATWCDTHYMTLWKRIESSTKDLICTSSENLAHSI